MRHSTQAAILTFDAAVLCCFIHLRLTKWVGAKITSSSRKEKHGVSKKVFPMRSIDEGIHGVP